MGREIASLTDRSTRHENQRDEADVLLRQNQFLMAAFSGNKQTGGQNA